MPDAEQRYIRNRKNLPTDLTSKAISRNIPAQIRARSFFSARVAEAHILNRFRNITDQYMTGKIGRDEARNLMLEYARANGHDDGTRAITNLASTARLNLIIDQNAAMAAAVGQYEHMYSPSNKKVFPYVIYRASVGSHKPRPEHQKYDGHIFSKDDPWLKTHWPPWDFGCHCQLENCTEKKAGKTPDLIHDPEEVSNDAPKSGYAFDPSHAMGEFDYTAIEDPKLRQEAKTGVEKIMTEEKPTPVKELPQPENIPEAEPVKEPEKTENQKTESEHQYEMKTQRSYSEHKAEKLEPELENAIHKISVKSVVDGNPKKINSLEVKDLPEGTPAETDQNGNIVMSKETAGQLNSAHKKANEGRNDFTNDELIAIESVTHEINHLRQNLIYSPDQFVMAAQEVVNEELSRYLFKKQAAQLGFNISKAGLEYIQLHGWGYAEEVSRLRNIADALGCRKKYLNFICNEVAKLPGDAKLKGILDFFLQEMEQQGIPKDPLLSVNDFLQNEGALVEWIKHYKQ